MKYFVYSCLLLALFTAKAHAQIKLSKQWTTDSILQVPESVLYSKADNILYVSIIGGNPAVNGKGAIAKLTQEGQIIDSNWITGLNAPKGLGRYGNLLYVADVTEVVVIDIAKGAIAYKIPIDSAVFLNDITIDIQGAVYVSDSRRNTVHVIRRKQASLYLSNLNNVNGLLATPETFYAVSAGRLLAFDEAKKMTVLASGMEKSTDGLVQLSEEEFIVSAWIGVIYYVKKDGTVRTLEDFRSTQTNTADLGYNPKTKTLFVPTFYKKSVMSYKVY
ncbi:SMP-30/gluconolactonase/LRE family protein [Filimonas lacunae]|nr:hypothetical protein [Filimonas lacunae]